MDIRELRRSFRLTQGQLATITGVKPNWISIIETGIGEPGKTLEILLLVFEQFPEVVEFLLKVDDDED